MGLFQAISSALIELLHLGLVATCFMGKVRERCSVPMYRDLRWKSAKRKCGCFGPLMSIGGAGHSRPMDSGYPDGFFKTNATKKL